MSTSSAISSSPIEGRAKGRNVAAHARPESNVATPARLARLPRLLPAHAAVEAPPPRRAPDARRGALCRHLEAQHVAPVVVGRAVARVHGRVEAVEAGREIARGHLEHDARFARELLRRAKPSISVLTPSTGRPETVAIANPKTKSDSGLRRAHGHLDRRRLARAQAARLASLRRRAGARPRASPRPSRCACRRRRRPRRRREPALRPSSARHPLAVERHRLRAPARRRRGGRGRARSRGGSARRRARGRARRRASVLPARSNSENFSRQRCAKASSPTASTSSTSSTSGSLWAAIAKPSRTAMPEE